MAKRKIDESFRHDKKPPTPENLLTESDKEMYGDREPEGYIKKNMLGKGGAAVVWLGVNQKKESVALK